MKFLDVLHLLSRTKKPSIAPAVTNPLVAAQRRLWEDLSSNNTPDALILFSYAMRYYTFMNILNGRIREKQQIAKSLANVDIIWEKERFRIATIRPTTQDDPVDIEKIGFDYMARIGNNLSASINHVLFRVEHGEFLCHIVDGQGDIVCLIVIPDGHNEAEYFVNFFQNAAAHLEKKTGWAMTCALSREFTDIEQLASIYFETRREHDLLMDANTPGTTWAVEQHRKLLDDVVGHAESIWWVEPMRQYVMDNYSNPDLNVSFLAKKFDISLAYTGRKFHEVTGIGLLELIHRCRLTELDRLVANGSKLKDALAAVGYSNWLTMQRARERYPNDQ